MSDFKNRLIEAMALKQVSRYKLSKDCGLSPTTVTNWIAGHTVPDKTKIEIVSKYLEVNTEWLITGNGEKFINKNKESISDRIVMLMKNISEEEIILLAKATGLTRNNVVNIINGKNKAKDINSEILNKIANYLGSSSDWLINGGDSFTNKYRTTIEAALKDTSINIPTKSQDKSTITLNNELPAETRPRIPYAAAAGALTSAVEGIMAEQCEQIPRITAFPDYDFTIIIKGNSMEPKYEGGDEVACKRVDSTSFIQWGKVHVMDTAQGIVIKRVYEDGDKIRCVSYNPEYPDFSMEKDEIYSMSLVVGLLRM